MSELRIALVAEGQTDAIVIDAALKALLPAPFVLTRLQPEPTRPKMGAGWGGVLRWCREFAGRNVRRLEDDPTLPGFDLFIIHVDADVAESEYADVSGEIATVATRCGWPVLPCSVPCPPASRSVDEMRLRLLAWADLAEPGPKTVLCIPSKALEAWLVAALFDQKHPLLNNLECNLQLGAQLNVLPKSQRVKKTIAEYRNHENQIVKTWATVRKVCSQAERFSCDVLAVTCRSGP